MWAAGPVVAGLVPGEGWGAASGPRPWALPARRHAGRPCGPGIVAGPGLPAPPVGAPCDAASLCPQDIVAGDMSRRDLWEQKGGPKTSSTVKVRLNAADAGGGAGRAGGRGARLLGALGRPSRGRRCLPPRRSPWPRTSRQSTPSGKRYKFVATGHGKYEKVLVDEGPAP